MSQYLQQHTGLNYVTENFPAFMLCVNTKHSILKQIGFGASNNDVQDIVGVVDDQSLREEVESCKHFLTDTAIPTKQYSTSKIRIKEIGGKIKPPEKYEVIVLVFYDYLGSLKCNKMNQFIISWRKSNLDIYQLTQSYFGLPK